jgi:hypothetical protein
MAGFSLRKNSPQGRATGAPRNAASGFILAATAMLLTLVRLTSAQADDLRSYIGKEYWSPGPHIVCPSLEGWTKGAGGCANIDRGTHFRVVDAVHTDDLLDLHDIRDYFIIAFDDGSNAFIHQSDITSGCCYLTEPPGTEEAKQVNDFIAKIKAEDARKQAKAIKEKRECEKKGGVSIGMTQQQVLQSCWGRPRASHSTTTASGTEEQWIYGNTNYLYFTNGLLVLIQH